jgi:protein-disulfide isomerase-like protein with CxxC motif
MSQALYFIYDSHCPWSYATASLLTDLVKAFPEIHVNTLHCAYYNGSDSAGFKQVKEVEKQSKIRFSQEYMRFVDSPKTAIITANLMAWITSKQEEKALPILNALQKAHFIDGNPLGHKRDFTEILDSYKLSVPNKVFSDTLSSDANIVLADLQELQEFMGTTSFPALLLVNKDNATLLNHAAYLNDHNGLIKDVARLIN